MTMGLTRLPVAVAIALWALVAARFGLAVGAKMGERWRERAEQVAATVLILLGVYLITERFVR